MLQKLKCTTDSVVIIGDSPTDIETAKLAGILCHCVSTGAHSVDELLCAGAITAHHSLEELGAMFQSITTDN